MIYLDNSATTRPFDSAIEAMAACMRETYFNPSSLYAPAMRAGEILAEARREILSAVGGRGQVFFTSGGTEADNLAILGAQRALRGRSGNFLTTKVEHPAVLETAITGVPDPLRGQVVKATIVLKPGYEPSDALKKELQDHVKHLTAPYKYPRVVEFVDSLPKTISGKIRRTELRARDAAK